MTIWTKMILWWLQPVVVEEPVVEWLLRRPPRVTLHSTNREWVASHRLRRRRTTLAVMFLTHLTWRATYLVTWRWLYPSCRPVPYRSPWTIKPTLTASLTPPTRRANRPVLSPIRSKLKTKEIIFSDRVSRSGRGSSAFFFIIYNSPPPHTLFFKYQVNGSKQNVVHVLHLRIYHFRSFSFIFFSYNHTHDTHPFASEIEKELLCYGVY